MATNDALQNTCLTPCLTSDITKVVKALPTIFTPIDYILRIAYHLHVPAEDIIMYSVAKETTFLSVANVNVAQ